MGHPAAEQDSERAAALAPLTGQPIKEEQGCLARFTNSKAVNKGRNLISYWILGFGNNFTYWVLITAAVDILARTGAQALLVAETLPAASISISALFFLKLPVNVRVFLVVSLCLTSYLALAFSAHVWLDFAGVLCASVSRGFSDITFLSYAGQYERDVLSTWSSGTGAATFVGPLIYSAMVSAGFSPRRVLLTMVTVPIMMGLSFWVILGRPQPSEPGLQMKQLQARSMQPVEDSIKTRMLQRLRIMQTAFKLILPLCVFYLEMYFIGSGLLELIYFTGGVWLTPSQQYSWYITIHCFGVMVARSGHKWFHTDKLWLPVIYQSMVLVFLLSEAHFRFLPSVWIMFGILLIQGLVEGTEFKSTMFKIYNEVDEADREECLAMMPVAFFFPAVMSGLAAIPAHTALCRLR
ncbi:Battenin [Amphibalanus amphitrite]|uniref:Battenin n=1 Tax=Amphibalanus amphitrite TaxID=1232801 RepID=A0A6A4XEB4_AMPAM|nr:Battenin [Amphibalanus amphitrite]